MPRSVNSVASRRRRKKILKAAKGYFGARSNVYTVAKNAVEKGMQYAYRDRRNKKRAFRRLWIARINAGARLHGISYSRFMHKLKEEEETIIITTTTTMTTAAVVVVMMTPKMMTRL